MSQNNLANFPDVVGRGSHGRLPQVVTTAVAARMLQITPDGVRWLARTHQLAFELTGSCQRVYRRSEILRVAQARTEARGRRRQELLADVRPHVLRAPLRPTQLRIRIVGRKVTSGSRSESRGPARQ